MQDLDGLNTETLDYTDTNIRTNLAGNLDALITPLITHTDQLYYDSGTTGNGNVHWVNSSSANQVNWKQLKFAIRLYEIIQAIETKYSEINFSTDFFCRWFLIRSKNFCFCLPSLSSFDAGDEGPPVVVLCVSADASADFLFLIFSWFDYGN